MSFEQYRKRMEAVGATRRESTVNHSVDVYNRYAVQHPSCQNIILEGEFTQALVLDGDDYATKSLCGINGQRFMLGQLVEYNGRPWLVTDVNSNELLYCKAQIKLCNYLVKFTNKKGRTVMKPCIISDVTKYLVGEQAADMMTVGASRMSLWVSKDKDTIDIERGTRLLVDDPDADECIAYEVTKPDRISGTLEYDGVRRGVYKYLIRETNSLDTDDKKHMLPDNDPYEPGTPDPDVKPTEHDIEGGWF